MVVEIRCKNCSKLLGWFEGKGEIKCPRINCGCKNTFDTKTGKITCVQNNHVKMRDRNTSSGHTFR